MGVGGLAYDDSAAAVFGVTLLLFWLVPATWYIVARLLSWHKLCGCGRKAEGSENVSGASGVATARSRAEAAKLRIIAKVADKPDVLMTPRFQVRMQPRGGLFATHMSKYAQHGVPAVASVLPQPTSPAFKYFPLQALLVTTAIAAAIFLFLVLRAAGQTDLAQYDPYAVRDSTACVANRQRSLPRPRQ